MALSVRTTLLLSLFLSLVSVSSAQSCSNYRFQSNDVFNSCVDLPVLQAHLHWNYINSTRKIQLAYRANQTSAGWIAWAINPTGTGMTGSQALVAYRNSNGSMVAYTTPIDGYNPSMQPGNLSFQVSNLSATFSNNEITIFAVVGPLQNGTANQVWQAGDSLSNDVPSMHATSEENIQSLGTIDFF